MSGAPIVIVQPDPDDGPELLAAVLDRRNRTTVVVGVDDTLPAPDGVRGVAVLGVTAPVAIPQQLGDWLVQCSRDGVPLLAMSEGAHALTTTTTTLTPADATMLRVDLMPDSADDDVFGDVPAGSLWPVTAPALAQLDGTTAALLVDPDSNPAAARAAEPTYLTRLAPYRSAATLAQRLPDHADTITAAARFHDALATSLLGRWIDAAIGRTDQETPWGRKGPQPIAHPGMYLNPLPA